jgi:hypothetical protein
MARGGGIAIIPTEGIALSNHTTFTPYDSSMPSRTIFVRATFAAFAFVGTTPVAAATPTTPTDSTPSTRAQGAPAAGTFAFVDVSVLPMDRDRVLTGQTVVVRDGRIAALGPSASVRVPADAQRIDGRGKYLMPGLAEMHAHVLGPAQPQELNRDIMFLYVANGVTTIRAMLGAPNQLVLREQLKKGEVLCPTMFVAAPSLNGNSAPNPDTAMKLVRAHKSAGYDLVKLHPGLSRATYDSAVKVAGEVGITLGGHVSAQVGIDRTLEARQSTIDHLDGYIEGAVSDDLKRRIMSPTEQVPFSEWRAGVTEDKMRELARRTREAGVWNVPTVFLWESLFGPFAPESAAVREEMKYAPKQWVTNWINQKKNQAQGIEKAGYLPSVLFRASRLVVDTGLHAKGWSRQKATDYMTATTGFARPRVQREVERYCTQMGQACSYKVGHMAWTRARAEAQAALGARFDLKQFHEVLKEGAMPLLILQRRIKERTAAAMRS